MNNEKLDKLYKGYRGYFPPNYEYLSIKEKEDIHETIVESYLSDYEEYYNEQITNIFNELKNEFLYTILDKRKLFYTLESVLRKTEATDRIINRFRWKINTDMEDKYASIYVKLYDFVMRNRIKIFEISFTDETININLIEDTFIPFWR